MTIRYSELNAIQQEFQNLIGAQVQKITQPSHHEIYFQLRIPGWTAQLLISMEAGQERVHLVEQRPPSLPTPPTFCMVLRKHLKHARLIHCSIHENDKIILLGWKRGEEQHTLICECRSRRGQVFLCGEALRIQHALLPLSFQRGLRRGDTYLAPDPLPHQKEQPPTPPEFAEPLDEKLSLFPHNIYLARQTQTHNEAQRFTQYKQLCTKTRRRDLKKKNRLLTNLERDKQRCYDALKREVDAELLKGNMHEIKRGDTHVSVVDYYDPELKQRDIKLDPALSPQENLEKLFKKIKRAKKGLDIISPRIEEVEEDILQIEEELEEIESIQTAEELVAYLPSEQKRQVIKRKKTDQKSAPYKEYKAQTGHKILVGRNSKANDELTFRVAKGNDIWLHARGVAGSHVIVPLQKQGTIPQDVLLDAATLAAHNSKSRNQTHIEVMYTETKYVKKLKGAPPGQVTVQRDNNITIRIDEERLKRLLGSVS
ncbi:MAG: hypothetical protein CL920_37105 [Deltaproteobacteria bacterium]|nr:hypothetical protein [Deltaproteobacteria bacterium]MBU54350.1 hypothetical protein [Deltaproteobacteria bacterium]|tara:strand:+ start:1167 stop:2618 length:1452 start_codon:yes stop_codon:yes gene_type:complete